MQENIRLVYKTVDGVRKRRTYKTLKGARRFAQEWIGDQADSSTAGTKLQAGYAVSYDGIATLIFSGCTFSDLWPPKVVEEQHEQEPM